MLLKRPITRYEHPDLTHIHTLEDMTSIFVFYYQIFIEGDIGRGSQHHNMEKNILDNTASEYLSLNTMKPQL